MTATTGLGTIALREFDRLGSAAVIEIEIGVGGGVISLSLPTLSTQRKRPASTH